MSEELTKVATTCTPQQMMDAMAYTWKKLFDEDPKKESICVLLAQWAMETGWGKYCWCWNVGNFKHVDGDGRSYTYYRCNEIIHGKEVWYDPSVDWQRPYCCFRAYKTIEEGVLDYVASLHKHFTLAWPDVLSGDPAAFCHDLKRQGYYTDSEAHYTSQVTSIFRTVSKLNFTPTPTPTEGINVDQVMALVSLSLTETIREDLNARPESAI
jgi:hypothetical protein